MKVHEMKASYLVPNTLDGRANTDFLRTYCTAAYAMTKTGAKKYLEHYKRLTFTNCDDQLLAYMKWPEVKAYVLQRNMMDQYKTLLNLTVSQIEDEQAPAEWEAELNAQRQALQKYGLCEPKDEVCHPELGEGEEEKDPDLEEDPDLK